MDEQLPPANSEISSPAVKPLQKKRISNKKIIAIISIFIVGLIILALIFLLARNNKSELNMNSEITNTEKGLGKISTGKFNPNNSYIIKDSKIYEITENGDELLFFTNVGDEVINVRPGPDGNTLHFKFDQEKIKSEEYVHRAYCADFGKEIKDYPSSLPSPTNPPPKKAPWDFKRVGTGATLRSCESSIESGFLKNSDLFSYIKLNNANEGTLVIERNDELFEIQLDDKITEGFLSDHKNTNSYWSNPKVGIDGNKYVYPIHDSYIVNNKLIIAFDRLILAINLNDNKLFGSFSLNQPDYDIVSTAFSFEVKEDIPFIVIDSGWEGFSSYQAVVDFSKDELKIVKLKDIDKTGMNLFDLRKVTWGENEVRISLYSEKNVSSEVKEVGEKIDYSDYYDEEYYKPFDAEAEQILRANKNYIDVKCSYAPSALGIPCYAATDLKTYKYSPGGPLQELKF